MADKAIVYTSNHVTDDKRTLQQLVRNFAHGVLRDFKTTNQATAGKVAKFGAGAVVVGGSIAKYYEVYTPLQWALRGFGHLPAEFTKSGAIQVFEYSAVQRAVLVARAAAVKFALVTIAYEGGVLIGSAINQTLSDETKNDIGGTINEIVNEGGWRELYRHPFGRGL